MDEDLDPIDQPLMFETLAASLELDKKEARTLVESLATMLQGALPDQVTVSRGGWILSKEKPIEEMTIRFDEVHYQIIKQKGTASYSGKVLKVVRGIALKSTDMELQDCIQQIVKELSSIAAKNNRMKIALQKFITG